MDRSKTLEQLDGEDWGEPGYNSGLVTRVLSLRKKPLNEFTAGDLRIIIGQKFNLEELMPLAIEQLQNDILIEADLYPGDLLKSVLSAGGDYWQKHKNEWRQITDLINQHRELLNDRQILKSLQEFERIQL